MKKLKKENNWLNDEKLFNLDKKRGKNQKI